MSAFLFAVVSPINKPSLTPRNIVHIDLISSPHRNKWSNLTKLIKNPTYTYKHPTIISIGIYPILVSDMSDISCNIPGELPNGGSRQLQYLWKKSCTTLDAWKPETIMGKPAPINWCRISQPSIVSLCQVLNNSTALEKSPWTVSQMIPTWISTPMSHHKPMKFLFCSW